MQRWPAKQRKISIHAPLRERQRDLQLFFKRLRFQSTLPYGSDKFQRGQNLPGSDFNPRSLTGATNGITVKDNGTIISIHAPLRERQYHREHQSHNNAISIHAPLRERPSVYLLQPLTRLFQSTLPYGSDFPCRYYSWLYRHFNPRSLTGATRSRQWAVRCMHISIHAPLRERHRLRNLKGV